MKRLASTLALSAALLFGAVAAPATGQSPAGQLVVFADLSLFAGMGKPDNCVLKNRFKSGEPVGFRITAVDGGTGDPETTAEVVVHITYGGQTIDVPAVYRGRSARGAGIPNLWTAKWTVPTDAPTGTAQYNVTAKDAKGRTATFTPFPNQGSQLTIVQ